MAFSGIASPPYDLKELELAWKSFGSQLSFDLSVNYGLCVVAGCAGMSFVGLRTESGPRPVCLRHFDLLQNAKTPSELDSD